MSRACAPANVEAYVCAFPGRTEAGRFANRKSFERWGGAAVTEAQQERAANSVMQIVPDAEAAIGWYTSALGAAIVGQREHRRQQRMVTRTAAQHPRSRGAHRCPAATRAKPRPPGAEAPARFCGAPSQISSHRSSPAAKMPRCKFFCSTNSRRRSRRDPPHGTAGPRVGWVRQPGGVRCAETEPGIRCSLRRYGLSTRGVPELE